MPAEGTCHRASPRAAGDAGTLEPGRTAALAVFDAWQADELYSLEDSRISTAASTDLQGPIDPIFPLPAVPDDCHGEPDSLNCDFSYPGIGIHLDFLRPEVPGGLRVAQIRCFISDIGEEPLDECAARVRES